MRMWTRSGGKHPALDSTVIHQWAFDETTVTHDARDVIGTADLAQTSSPTCGNGPINFRSRGLDGSADYFLSAVYATDMAAMRNMTLAGCFKVTTWAARTIFRYGSNGGNLSLAFNANANGTLNIAYTDTAAGAQSFSTTESFKRYTGAFIPFVLTRTDSGANDGVYKLYVFGGLVQSWTGKNSVHVTNATARFHVGVDEALLNFLTGSVADLTLYNAVKTDAQCEDILRDMTQLGYQTTLYTKVDVQDGGGNWVDLTSIKGHDFLKSVTWGRDVETRIASATVTLMRDNGSMRLGLYNDNVVNRIPFFDPPVSPSAWVEGSELLALTRPLRIMVDRRALGSGFAQDAGTANWNNVFEGTIDSVDWGSGEVVLECRDKGARLMDILIPIGLPDAYGSGAGVAAETVLQNIITDASGNTPTDYTDNWGLPASGAYYGVAGFWTVKTPVSPGWLILTFGVDAGIAVMEFLTRIADQIGWIFQSEWSEVDADWRMTFRDPPRNQVYPDMVIDENNVADVQSIKVDISDIRNEVWMSFVPKSGTTAGQLAIPTIVSGTDPTHAGAGTLLTAAADAIARARTSAGSEGNRVTLILKASMLDATEVGQNSATLYGVRRMGNAEEPTSQIDTITEAQLFALAVLRDLMEPRMTKTLRMPCTPEMTENNIIRVRQNGYWFTADQTLAAVNARHMVSGDDSSTDLGLRGRPSAGTARHLARETRPGVAPPQTTNPASSEDLLIGAGTRARRRFMAMMGELLPNHLLQNAAWGQGIRNSNFQARSFGNTPPDGWATAATWGTDLDLDTAVVESGQCSLKLISTSNSLIFSDYTPVRGGETLAVEMRVKGAAGAGAPGTPRVAIDWFDSAYGYVSSSGPTTMAAGSPSESVWATQRQTVVAPATAAFARVTLGKITGADPYYCQWVRFVAERLVAESYSNVRAYLKNADINPGTKTEATVVYDEDDDGRPNAWDDLADFDVATGIFTAKESGEHAVAAQTKWTKTTGVGGTLTGYLRFTKGGTATVVAESSGEAQNNVASLWISVACPSIWLAAGDTLRVRAYADDSTGANPLIKTGSGDTWFTARRVRVE